MTTTQPPPSGDAEAREAALKAAIDAYLSALPITDNSQNTPEEQSDTAREALSTNRDGTTVGVQPAAQFITDSRIAEIRERLATITSGPWHVDKYSLYIFGPQSEMVADSRNDGPSHGAEQIVRGRGAGAKLPIAQNMEFIAHAREDVPWLIDHVAVLEARLNGLEQKP